MRLDKNSSRSSRPCGSLGKLRGLCRLADDGNFRFSLKIFPTSIIAGRSGVHARLSPACRFFPVPVPYGVGKSLRLFGKTAGIGGVFLSRTDPSGVEIPVFRGPGSVRFSTPRLRKPPGCGKRRFPFAGIFPWTPCPSGFLPPRTSDARSCGAPFSPDPVFGFPAGFSGGFPQDSGRFFRGRGGNPGFRRAAGAVFRWFCVLRGWKALVFHRSFPLIVEKSEVFFAPFFRPDFGFGRPCGKIWGSQPVSLVD